MIKPFYVTTAISYPNGNPHMGHAYEAIAADTLVRAHRMIHPVRLLTGTDEHGRKMEQAAEAVNLSPQEFANKKAITFQAMCDDLDVVYDRFIRTTDLDHKTRAQELWQAMASRGDIYLGRYSGWYSIRDEAYFSEDEVLNGLAPTGNPVEWMEEDSWFFRLSKYREQIQDHILANPTFIQPESARNKILADLKDLRDISISRTSFTWGIPVPDSPNHIMYVWVDALSNYLTGSDGAWPADVHIIGKDIIKFHCVYWPAFLMSADLPLPKQVFAHGFILNNGVKMSKSLGNVLDPMNEISAVGSDNLRFFLLREISFGQDGSYSRAALINRCNAELANGIGNLVSRTCALIVKRLDGVVPQAHNGADELALQQQVTQACQLVQEKLLELNFNGALADWSEAVNICNRYIAAQEPWNKSISQDRLSEVLGTLHAVEVELLKVVSPVMPNMAQAALDYLSNHPLSTPPPLFPRL